MSDPSAIEWPEDYNLENHPVHVENTLDMSAAQDRVWAWLVHAPLWPGWYFNSANVTILNGPGPDLEKGTRFRWKTFGLTITSTVLCCDRGDRIAWDAHCWGFRAYHAWVLRPSEKGCFVLTEERQRGWLAWLHRIVLPDRMYRYHQFWLVGLEGRACSGLPPG